MVPAGASTALSVHSVAELVTEITAPLVGLLSTHPVNPTVIAAIIPTVVVI
jgi:hypothetical protein